MLLAAQLWPMSMLTLPSGRSLPVGEKTVSTFDSNFVQPGGGSLPALAKDVTENRR